MFITIYSMSVSIISKGNILLYLQAYLIRLVWAACIDGSNVLSYKLLHYTVYIF